VIVRGSGIEQRGMPGPSVPSGPSGTVRQLIPRPHALHGAFINSTLSSLSFALLTNGIHLRFVQRPYARELLKHKFIRRAKKIIDQAARAVKG
jgi:hypothetical protein